jgi:O-6-methylguanine DNA methyltransferase
MAARSSYWFLALGGTPLGPLYLTFSVRGLSGLTFGDWRSQFPQASEPSENAMSRDFPPDKVISWMNEALLGLANYFAGQSPDFSSLTLDLQGTPFEHQVWQELCRIPWGKTISYKELAARIGNPRATQAVGQANGANPIPLIIPCHRVIQADGSLGGYSSGPERKKWLLEHESVGEGRGTFL